LQNKSIWSVYESPLHVAKSLAKEKRQLTKEESKRVTSIFRKEAEFPFGQEFSKRFDNILDSDLFNGSEEEGQTKMKQSISKYKNELLNSPLTQPKYKTAIEGAAEAYFSNSWIEANGSVSTVVYFHFGGGQYEINVVNMKKNDKDATYPYTFRNQNLEKSYDNLIIKDAFLYANFIQNFETKATKPLDSPWHRISDVGALVDSVSTEESRPQF
jgi:hypothetical protein